MPKKCECGLWYVPGHPEDETKHERWHSEYLNGPEIAVVKDISNITTINSFSVSVADRHCPLETRRELAYVASIARRSMADYPAGYDGTVDEDDQRLYIAADGERIVAMVITMLEDFFYQCSWDKTGSFKLWHQPPEECRKHKITRIWTAPSCQKKGLATQMVKMVTEHLPCNIADLGWELPLSKPGENLVKRFCSDLFWGCGDNMIISDYL